MAIENAIYEGMATVFEREYCGVWQPYGDYRNTSEEKLKTWIKDLQRLSLDEFEKNYKDWKFFHPKLKERWIVYKTGTWMIDQILQKNKLTIIDLRSKTATEILDIYNEQGSNPAW